MGFYRQYVVFILMAVAIFSPLFLRLWWPIGLVWAVALYWIVYFVGRKYKSWAYDDEDRDYFKNVIFTFAMIEAFGFPMLVIGKNYGAGLGLLVGLPIGLALVALLVKLNDRFEWVTDKEHVEFVRRAINFIPELFKNIAKP